MDEARSGADLNTKVMKPYYRCNESIQRWLLTTDSQFRVARCMTSIAAAAGNVGRHSILPRHDRTCCTV